MASNHDRTGSAGRQRVKKRGSLEVLIVNLSQAEGKPSTGSDVVEGANCCFYGSDENGKTKRFGPNVAKTQPLQDGRKWNFESRGEGIVVEVELKVEL